MTVPSNLIPFRITQLPVDPSPSITGILMYVRDGVSYQVTADQIVSVSGVPLTRQVNAGTGLTGGGPLSNNVTISVAPGGIGSTELAASGVTPGVYGSNTAIPVLTIDATGRVTAATTAAFSISGFVPTTRQVIAGTGLNGGGQLTSNVTLNANLSNATPQPLDTTGTSGVSNDIARADHKHPAINLADDDEVDGILGLASGGTGRSLVSQPGAIVWSGGDGLYVGPAGSVGQVLVSGGTGQYTWGSVQLLTPVAANVVFAGPTSGPNVDPSFRALVNADIPSTLNGKTIESSTITNAATITAGSASITNLAVSSLTVSSLSLTNATFTSATITTLKSTSADITNIAAHSLTLTNALKIGSGGTGLSSTPTIGQLLIGNGLGYTQATLTAGANVSITSSTGSITIAATGDVVGPAGATTDAITLFDGGSGKLLKNSVITINGSGVISNVDTPNVGTDAANKQYVDNLVSTGIHIHEAVVLATSAGSSRTDTYNNGTAGVSATLTSVAAGTLVIDGTVASANIRVLIQDCSNPIGNGVYVVTNPGSGAAQYVMTRSSDADTTGQQSTQSLDDGSYFFTTGGTSNKGAAFVNTNSGTIDFGSTAITFALFSVSQVYSAGNGLSLTATTFSLETPVAILNGGTGATTQSGARTALGLGTMAVQDASSVNITGGDISVSSANITTLTGTTFGTTAATQLRGASADITNLSVSSLTVSSLSLANATFTSATITTLTSSSANITTLTSGSLTVSGNSVAAKFVPTGGTDAGNGMYLPSANTIAFSTNGTRRVNFDASGNVLVGGASSLSPAANSVEVLINNPLVVSNGGSVLAFGAQGSRTGYVIADASSNLEVNSTSGYVQLSTAGGSLRLTSAGNLTVSSSTLVINLNADLLDGQHGSYYLNLANATGNISGGTY